MLDYFSRKAKKFQNDRHAEEGVETPVLDEADAQYLTKVISADGVPPPLPARPNVDFGPTAGDFEDNILQLILYDSAAAAANARDQDEDKTGSRASEESEDSGRRRKGKGRADKEKGKKKPKETLKMTAEESAELEKLVDAVKEKTRDKSRERGKAKDKGKDKDKTRDQDKKEKKDLKEDKEDKKPSRFSSIISRSGTKKGKDKKGLEPTTPVGPDEAVKEAEDLNKVLDDINLSSANNRAFSFSNESQKLVKDFTVILKDLINGVPTAYDDLTHLLDKEDNVLKKNYEHLPSFLQKLISGLPKKVGERWAPEIMAAAGDVSKLRGAAPDGSAGLKGLAQSFLTIATFKELVTNPSGVTTMLKTVMNALKMRWPAFLGTNVLLSLGVFVVLLVFWYCHKRGREVRLEREGFVDKDGNRITFDDEGNPIPVDKECNPLPLDNEVNVIKEPASGSSSTEGESHLAAESSRSTRDTSEERRRNPEIEEADDDRERRPASNVRLLEYRSLESEKESGESSRRSERRRGESSRRDEKESEKARKEKERDRDMKRDKERDRDGDREKDRGKKSEKKKRRSSH